MKTHEHTAVSRLKYQLHLQDNYEIIIKTKKEEETVKVERNEKEENKTSLNTSLHYRK